MVWTYTVDEELAKRLEFAEGGNFKLRQLLFQAREFIPAHTEEDRALRQTIDNILREAPV